MTDTSQTRLLERYRRLTFYPAADNDARWVGAMLARFCPPGGRVLDPFCGSGVMSLVAALGGYEGLASDSNPLTEVFIQMFRGNACFFAELRIDPAALGDRAIRAAIERIYRSAEFEHDAASVHALLYCASGAPVGRAGEREPVLQTYRRIKADAAGFMAALKPYAPTLERNLGYRLGDLAGIDLGRDGHVCFFDPPYFGRGSFTQFCAPLLALLGRRMPDDQALLTDETLYQRALGGWLSACYDALSDDGVIVFTLSPGASVQRRQVLAAAAVLGLDIDQADYDGVPFLYAAKRPTLPARRVGTRR